jgi:riboflavin kinase/FMN adenylyltransferase
MAVNTFADMTLPVQLDSLEAATVLPSKPLHLAIGMFDGLHLGHRAVVEAAVKAARKTGGLAGVLTFWPHPSTLFRPDHPTRLIQDTSTKVKLLFELGIDVVITQHFTPEFAGITAEDFVPRLKQYLPSLVSLYVGENWRFGRGRRGDVTFLTEQGKQHDLNVFSTPRVNLAGVPISSTRIRELIEAGDMATANTLLGYAYFAQGLVVPGKRLGRTLGFPTLNLAWSPELRPRFGVYAVRVGGRGAATPLPAVANYGLRPTVEAANEPRLEAHVLGNCPFGEGDRIKVEWLRFIRPEMKFGNLDELSAQIARDRIAAETDFSLR